MRLERIKIEGYRSLKDIAWHPGAVNILIGANASGKSNLLKALALLQSATAGKLKSTILQSGGMAPLLWNGSATRISFGLQLDEGVSFSMVVSRLGETGSFQITEEYLDYGEDRLTDRTFAELARAVSPTEPVLSFRLDREMHAKAYEFQAYLARWSVYHGFNVEQSALVRQSAVARMEKSVDPDGQNLVPVLHTLYETDRTFEGQIDDAMSAAFPGAYEKLKFTPLEDGRIQLRLRWKHSRRLSNAADLSDGTLRFLMLLAILGSPDPAPLIAIDEPETGLHPGMLPLIAEFATEASKKSQIILSTHSPQFLDAFGDTLPAVTVFQWVEDRTELRTLAGDELRKWVEDYSLGKFCFSGEAEAIS